MPRQPNNWCRVAPLMLVAAFALSGCGSMSPSPSSPVAEATGRGAVPSKHPALPPAGSGRGGYYLDDGPGEAPPDGLEALADAEPRVEPYSKRGNKPYVVFGKTYTPFTDDRPFKQRGRGSWYGKKFHGQKTSSGELYDMYQMTAAHPTLPIPSYARVTHVGNGKQVIVRVNDRGPFLAGRVVDLSYTAALKLGYIRHGSAELEVERLLPDEIERMAANRRDRSTGAALEAGMDDRNSLTAVPAADMPPAATPVRVVQQTNAATGVSNYYLQFGAYSQQANAEAVRTRLAQNWTSGLPLPEVAQTGTLYRIYSGPFSDRGQADFAAGQLENGGTAKPVIVQR